MLLLPLPPPHLPRPPRRRRRPRHRPGRQAQEAPVRSPAGRRPVPPRRSLRRHRNHRLVAGGVPLPQHHPAVHGGEPEQGGDPVREDAVRGDVPRGAAGRGHGPRVRAAGPLDPADPDPGQRQPVQRPPGRRPRPHPRRRRQRPRRAPHHRRCRRQDPLPRLHLPTSPGIGGLRDSDQPAEAVADVQAMRCGRIERVNRKKKKEKKNMLDFVFRF